jgi:hypothetical protein
MSDLKNCRLLVTPTSYGKSDPACIQSWRAW